MPRSHRNKELYKLRKLIGNNIYKIRMRRKMTLTKLSKLTNIPVSSLDYYEIGGLNIAVTEIYKISNAMEIKPESLFKISLTERDKVTNC